MSLSIEDFPERELQIDHRVPYEIAGDKLNDADNFQNFMLLSGSANRAKSWSCEQCKNWVELKEVDICKKCYWAYPDNYEHIAMLPIRRVDILWKGEDVKTYKLLKRKAIRLHKEIPEFIKELIISNLNAIED